MGQMSELDIEAHNNLKWFYTIQRADFAIGGYVLAPDKDTARERAFYRHASTAIGLYEVQIGEIPDFTI